MKRRGGERASERSVDGATQEWKRSRRRIKMEQPTCFPRKRRIHPSVRPSVRLVHTCVIFVQSEVKRGATKTCSLARSLADYDSYGGRRAAGGRAWAQPLHLIFKHHHSEESALLLPLRRRRPVRPDHRDMTERTMNERRRRRRRRRQCNT